MAAPTIAKYSGSMPAGLTLPSEGRTSIVALQAFDPLAASLSATSRSGASMIQKSTNAATYRAGSSPDILACGLADRA